MSFNPPKVAEWQWLDESCGLWYPWYTLPALEEISKWDLKEKVVLEYGGGKSTLWWREKAKKVVTVEANESWLKMIDHELRGARESNCTLLYCPINEGDQLRKFEYINAADPLNHSYDIVVVDGILRTECLEKGISLLSERGGKIIADNFDQSYVWISPKAIEIMQPYKAEYHVQRDHTNHDGKPWQTVIFTIPAGGNPTGAIKSGKRYSRITGKRYGI